MVDGSFFFVIQLQTLSRFLSAMFNRRGRWNRIIEPILIGEAGMLAVTLGAAVRAGRSTAGGRMGPWIECVRTTYTYMFIRRKPSSPVRHHNSHSSHHLHLIITAMASTNSWTHEIESSVAAPRLFRAGVMDWHTLAPKLAPHIVTSAHPVEGEGGIGSIRQFNFTSAMPFSLMKEKLEFIDADKCECKSTLIEGGGIDTAIETATSHIKVEPAANGGSVVKVESTYKLLIESPVPASRLFRAGVMDWHTLAPKLAPHIVTSAHPIEGEGGIGSVRRFNFTSAMPFSLMKERLEFIDVDKCECKSTLIEGGSIGTAIEMATSHIKVEPAANGGSVVKVESTYKLLPGVEVNDDITKAKDSVTAIFKAAEAYLIANPDAYN